MIAVTPMACRSLRKTRSRNPDSQRDNRRGQQHIQHSQQVHPREQRQPAHPSHRNAHQPVIQRSLLRFIVLDRLGGGLASLLRRERANRIDSLLSLRGRQPPEVVVGCKRLGNALELQLPRKRQADATNSALRGKPACRPRHAASAGDILQRGEMKRLVVAFPRRHQRGIPQSSGDERQPQEHQRSRDRAALAAGDGFSGITGETCSSR